MQARIAGSAALLLLLFKITFCVTDVSHPPGLRTIRLCAAAVLLLLCALEYFRPWLGLKLALLLWPQMLILRELLALHAGPLWGGLPVLWDGALAAGLATAVWARLELRPVQIQPQIQTQVQAGTNSAPPAPATSLSCIALWVLAGAILVSALAGQCRVLTHPTGWRIQPTDPRHLLDLSVFDSFKPLIRLVDLLPPVLLAIVLLRAVRGGLEAPSASLCAWIAASGTLVALEWTYGVRNNVLWGFDLTKPVGTPFSNRNTTGVVLAVSAACAAALAASASIRARWRVFAALLALGISGVALAVGSRNGLFALAMLGWLLLASGSLEPGRRGKACLAAALGSLLLALAALVFLPLPAPESLPSEALQRAVTGIAEFRKGDLASASSDRLGMWSGAWHIFQDYPLAGSGLATIPMALTPTGPYRQFATYFDADGYITHVHSYVLQLLAECGLLAALAWLAAFVALPFFALLRRRNPGTWAIPVLVMALANFFDAVWLTPGAPLLAVAVLLACPRAAPEHESKSR